jgi:hypothetical protein
VTSHATLAQTVSYSRAFQATPTVTALIKNAASGDYLTLASETRSSFDVRVFNAGGTQVSKTVNWVAVGNGASYAIAYSYDGISWTGVSDSKTLFDLSGGAIDMAWNGQVFVAVGANTNGYIVALSTDGITWTNSSSGTPYQLSNVLVTGISQGFTVRLPRPGVSYASYTLSTSSSEYTTTTITNPDVNNGSTASLAVPSASSTFTRGLVCTDSGFIMGGEPTYGILQYSTDYGNTWANLSNFFTSLGIFPICISNDATKMFICSNNI